MRGGWQAGAADLRRLVHAARNTCCCGHVGLTAPIPQWLQLQMVAVRCGTDKQDVLAAMQQDAAAAASNSVGTSVSGVSTGLDGLVRRLVPFAMLRTYTPAEGEAYAAAAVAAAAAEGTVDGVPAAQHLASAGLSEPSGSSSSGVGRLLGGRVVGRHRLTHRLLVVGFHKLPAEWEAGHQPAKQPQQQVEGPPPPHDAAAAADGADLLLPTWLPGSRALSSSEGVGLGDQRYQLPHVNSDTATHLLQFDGASRNNPGERQALLRLHACGSACVQPAACVQRCGCAR